MVILQWLWQVLHTHSSQLCRSWSNHFNLGILFGRWFCRWRSHSSRVRFRPSMVISIGRSFFSFTIIRLSFTNWIIKAFLVYFSEYVCWVVTLIMQWDIFIIIFCPMWLRNCLFSKSSARTWWSNWWLHTLCCPKVLNRYRLSSSPCLLCLFIITFQKAGSGLWLS